MISTMTTTKFRTMTADEAKAQKFDARRVAVGPRDVDGWYVIYAEDYVNGARWICGYLKDIESGTPGYPDYMVHSIDEPRKNARTFTIRDSALCFLYTQAMVR